MSTQYIATPTNMVTQVASIIEGYNMGALRALAQEPVQNSKDEKREKRVRVEYRLHLRRSSDGKEHHILTVTDSGTGGLKGPVLTQNELEARGHQLKDGENWAAFEGQGFTEKTGGEGGSRGQGKSALLYHSDPEALLGDGRERCLMLYDTLLENGEYRFGVRYANPSDRIQSPPLYNDEARDAIQGEYQVDDDLIVALGMEPLDKPGTRVIVPFLKESVIDAIREGELHRWLQRCWWRAIQVGDMEISIVDQNERETPVKVPSWWEDNPWGKMDPSYMVKDDIPVGREPEDQADSPVPRPRTGIRRNRRIQRPIPRRPIAPEPAMDRDPGYPRPRATGTPGRFQGIRRVRQETGTPAERIRKAPTREL